MAFSESQPATSDATVAGLMHNEAMLVELRDSMLAFARIQLGNDAMAEDCVQESLSAAFVNAEKFQRKAALKTWVFAILRNKIADALRKGARSVDATSLAGEHGAEEVFDYLFDTQGHWQPDCKPRAWRAPEDAYDDRQFWRVFDACIEHLPEQQARVFMMREMLDLNTDEILSATGLTLSNLNVSLYRARMRLRECLDTRWFNGTARGAA